MTDYLLVALGVSIAGSLLACTVLGAMTILIWRELMQLHERIEAIGEALRAQKRITDELATLVAEQGSTLLTFVTTLEDVLGIKATAVTAPAPKPSQAKSQTQVGGKL